MGKKVENIEKFKKAITSTIRSIAGNQNFDVVFGGETKKNNLKIINLPFRKL